MSEILGTFLWLYIAPLLLGVMVYFIIRPPNRGKHLVRITLIVILALLAAPFVFLAFAFGGIRGVIGAICELLFASGAFLLIPALIAGRLVRPFGDIFDGGDEPPEAAPFYYVARLRRNQHKYDEAIRRIKQQLEAFPTDFEGQMLLAEIQAEDLLDLSAAQRTVDNFLGQNGHPPNRIAQALNALADWHLRIAADASSAKLALRRIIELFPNTDLAESAAARLSSLG
jgi:tetratricopeptide (TPR) repeat protein